MVLVDAHVHLHGCFAPERFLNAAAANMTHAAHGMGLPDSTPGMLLFTHSAGDDAFGRLRTGSVGRWSLTATREANSMSAHRPGAPPLILVAGRQIVTAEGLEVLALGAVGPFSDGQPAEPTIETIYAHDGIPVLPWGFGKWWRGRGEIVQRLIADRARFPLLFLGDNASRPGIAPRPRLLGYAEDRHRPVLPGTDPLPLPEETDKVARLVFFVEREIDTDRPFADMKDWLVRCDTSPRVFGVYERPDVFLRRQIAMQRRKWQHSASSTP